MSLLQSLQYKEYEKALKFSLEQCKIIANVAGLRNLNFNSAMDPGKLLMKAMDRRGFSVDQYEDIIRSVYAYIQCVHYRPKSKVAILIGNDKYLHLGKLASPSSDCESLATKLKHVGFTVIILKNILSGVLKNVLKRLFEVIPEDSYCFIFYAGHGCEMYNIKCLLSIDCPPENIQPEHFITENFLLKEVAACKPDLCILILDMCRIQVYSGTNPGMNYELQHTPEFSIHRNLLISYATAPAANAYELLHIECSHSIASDETYELRSGDVVLDGASQYAVALCARLTEYVDVCDLLDCVHADLENTGTKQKPIKMQCGVFKRSLRDPVSGDVNEYVKKFEEVSKEFSECDIVIS